MPVYMLIEIEVRDPETYAEYRRVVPATIAQYGGRYIVRGGPVTPMGGDWKPERIIILEFPSMEQLNLWWRSPEYQAAAPLRERSAKTRSVVLEGYVAGA